MLSEDIKSKYMIAEDKLAREREREIRVVLALERGLPISINVSPKPGPAVTYDRRLMGKRSVGEQDKL